jgi:formiminoglutamate deiminase
MRLFADFAMLPDGLANDVLFEVVDGRFAAVTANAAATNVTRLAGVALPGFANCHSHAFHRALRGRTSQRGGDFWTWRQSMYEVAARLTPDSYLALARATYAEMALAGITSVGEFHYVHHGPRGARYDNPNAMAEALRQAAEEAGIRLTLLDACYLAGGLSSDGHMELDDVQRRFSDGDADAWAGRFADLRPSSAMQVGAAIHSVRAVPRDQIPTIVEAAGQLPLHVHVSEQPEENRTCHEFYGRTPTALLYELGALGAYSTVVHATHLVNDDVDVLAATNTTACFCPTTERDLADGIGPARVLQDAGVRLSLGTDQHTNINMFDEARALEMDERLVSLRRGRFGLTDLLDAATRHESIGWDAAGRLEVGAKADLVAVRSDTPRTAGTDPAEILLTASASDIDAVMVDGRFVVSDGEHVLGDVGSLLRSAIGELWTGT